MVIDHQKLLEDSREAHVGERYIGTMAKKNLDALMMATRRCMMERRGIVAVTSIDVGLTIKKELDAPMMAFLRCVMERCIVAAGVTGIDVGLMIKKEFDALMMAFR